MAPLRHIGRQHGAGRSGFTLIEMMAVILLVSIFATIAIMNVDSLLPYYNMRQSARQVGDILRRARFYAKHHSRDMKIMYDFDNGVCWIVPAEAVFDKSDPQKFALQTYRLPDGMSFDKIVFADDSSVETDIHSVRVTAGGLVEPHYIHIKAPDDRRYTVMVRMMAGAVEYADDYVRPEYDHALDN